MISRPAWLTSTRDQTTSPHKQHSFYMSIPNMLGREAAYSLSLRMMSLVSICLFLLFPSMVNFRATRMTWATEAIELFQDDCWCRSRRWNFCNDTNDMKDHMETRINETALRYVYARQVFLGSGFHSRSLTVALVIEIDIFVIRTVKYSLATMREIQAHDPVMWI